MRRLQFCLTVTLVLGFFSGICSVFAEEASGQKHPNLVIVFPDQMRGQALGFLNEDPVVTPHLDRFAQQGLVLTQAVSNYPLCSPFRAMLMTGQYAHTSRVTNNCRSSRAKYGIELQESAICWSDVLKTQGYSLGYIGKWHLDVPRKPYVEVNPHWNAWCPPERRHGFDYWYAYGTYDNHLRPMYWSTDAGRDDFHFVDQWGPEHEADMAIEYIRNTDGKYRQQDQPFALTVAMNPPHTPYDKFPKRYLKAYEGKTAKDLLVRPNTNTEGKTGMSKYALAQIKNYFANVTGVDEQFGRIVKAIDDAGLKDDTIVLFISDHGSCVGTHNEGAKNNPFEESMRIPFIMRWPGNIAARRDDLLISAPDIYPTMLELMGCGDATPKSVQGTSYAKVFLGEKGARPTSQLYMRIPDGKPENGLRGVRTHEYKLVMTAAAGKPLKSVLYDLKADPYELADIAAGKPDVIAKLVKTELKPWLKLSADPWIKHVQPSAKVAGK